MITLRQAKDLRSGDMLHSTSEVNSDGSARRWKVNGMPKTWIRKPGNVSVPVKHGLYTYGYVTQNDLNEVTLG